MDSPNITGKLANFSARRRWTVVGVWVVALLAALVVASGIDDVTTSDAGSNPDLESGYAQLLINERLDQDEASKEFVLVEFDAGTVETVNNRAFVSQLADDLLALEDVVGVASYVDGAEGLVTSDQRAALILTTLSVPDEEATGIIGPLMTVVEEANNTPGYTVASVGQGSVNSVFLEIAQETLAKGESIGIGLALIILLIIFGAAIAAGLPIFLAVVSIIVAVALSAIIGRVMDLPEFIVQIISMIGLAVGIDYALFIVKRFGEEIAKGKNKIEAITLAGNTAGRTVMVSGFAVMIALSGMLMVPDMAFRGIAIGAILVVVAAIFAATTLLPAIISILGHRVYWLRIPFIGRKITAGAGDSEKAGVWDKITHVVTARPVISIVITAGALLAVSSAVLTMNLGTNGMSSLPEGNPTRHAFEVITAEFSDGLITADIVVDTPDATAASVQTAIESLKADLATDSYYGDIRVANAPGNNLVVISAVMHGDSSDQAAEDALLRLRNEYIPSAFDGVADVYVTGGTAVVVDNVDLMTDWLPIVFGLVLGISFLLLMVVFRSIVVPIKAVVMNLLSVGAAYGLVVLVFQQGIGADLLGFQTSPVIEYGLPLFFFSILFGLSMDYHVFLLSRIKERYDETGDNKNSVAFGLRSTGGIITGAALIMVGVFGGFASGDLVVMQQMGFGLAAAVIIDATLVRSILVPASMVLLGDKNWYLPSWLEWIPRLDAEGEKKEAGSQEPVPESASPVFAPVVATVAATEGVGD